MTKLNRVQGGAIQHYDIASLSTSHSAGDFDSGREALSELLIVGSSLFAWSFTGVRLARVVTRISATPSKPIPAHEGPHRQSLPTDGPSLFAFRATYSATNDVVSGGPGGSRTRVRNPLS